MFAKPRSKTMNRLAIFVLVLAVALPLAYAPWDEVPWDVPAAAANDPSLWKADFDMAESCLANNPQSQARYSHNFGEEDCEPYEPSALRGIDLLIESHKHDDELSRIYQRHLALPCDSAAPRRFGGKLVLFVKIEKDGTVSEATVVSSTAHCPAFDEAVRLNVKTWKYPPAYGASNTHMVWKFSKHYPPGSYAGGGAAAIGE